MVFLCRAAEQFLAHLPAQLPAALALRLGRRPADRGSHRAKGGLPGTIVPAHAQDGHREDVVFVRVRHADGVLRQLARFDAVRGDAPAFEGLLTDLLAPRTLPTPALNLRPHRFQGEKKLLARICSEFPELNAQLLQLEMR